MGVILLKLEGPMQSWGISSRFTERHSQTEPSKSGIIGLISSALGRKRDESVEDLTKLKMGIRVDREGFITYDFHTTLDVLRANAKSTSPSNLGNVISRRFYISDACFLVGLEGDDESLLSKIMEALKNPKWPLFLGRKSFLPSDYILESEKIHQKALIELLKSYPWQGRKGDEKPESLRIVYDNELASGDSRLDIPISFEEKKYRSRNVSTEFISFELIEQEG